MSIALFNDDWPEDEPSPQQIRNEVRQVEPKDLASLYNIEIKSQEFPYSKDDLKVLLDVDSIHGMLLLNSFLPAGFVLYSVADNGMLLDIARLSIMPHALQDGGLRKMIDMLCIRVGDVPEPKLRMLISETEIESNFFRALLNEGFKGVGVAPDHFVQYGQEYDGIKLERG